MFTITSLIMMRAVLLKLTATRAVASTNTVTPLHVRAIPQSSKKKQVNKSYPIYFLKSNESHDKKVMKIKETKLTSLDISNVDTVKT